MTAELPLVIFTVMAQMSVGSFVVLGVIQLAGYRLDPKLMDRITDPALYAIGPILVLGMAASLLHLGTPLRAVNSLRHLGGSWLSREIAFGILFAVLGAAFAGVQWRKLLTPRLRQALAGATALVGLVLVYVISRVYTLRTVPSTDTWHTAVSFYATTFLLGSLAVGAALVIASRVRVRRGVEDEAAQALIVRAVRGIAIGSIVVLGVIVVALPTFLGSLAVSDSAAARESLDTLVVTYGGLSILQLVLIFAAVAVLAVFLVQLSRGKIDHRGLAVVVVTAFALAFSGELIGRMLFYASMVRIGM